MAIVTWNPSDKHANVILSNGDLTVTHASSSQSAVRGTGSVSSGKYYYELEVITKGTPNPSVGIGKSTASLSTYCGGHADSIGWSTDGNVLKGGASQAFLGTYTAGDRIGIAYDATAGKLWFAKNGAWNGDPAVGTGEAVSGLSGAFFPMCSLATPNELLTNFGAAVFTYTPPSGFVGWTTLEVNVSLPALTFECTPQTLQELVDNAIVARLPALEFVSTPVAPSRFAFASFDALTFAPTPVAPSTLAFKTLPALIFAPALGYLTSVRDPAAAAQVDILYRLTLTGAADALADIVLPMASFQSRLRDGEPSYLAVNIPNGVAWISAINARPNGQIVVERGYRFRDTGATQFDEIARVDLETVRQDEGARSYTLTLDGHRTEATTTPKVRAVGGASYRNVVSGKRRYRTSPDNFLRPGDTVQINAESFTVGLITLSVSPSIERMEIAEA